MIPVFVGIFVKGIGRAGNRTAALLITSAELGVLTTTPNARVTRRWNTSTVFTLQNLIALPGMSAEMAHALLNPADTGTSVGRIDPFLNLKEHLD